MNKTPHPIPYQGSKRQLASRILPFLPTDVERFYEPFAGSAAMSLFLAQRVRARRFVIGDSLASIVGLWQAIVERPSKVARQYAILWAGQTPNDRDYYNSIRERFNRNGDPVDLLYLICRCVKNAVRFGTSGNFTQSADHRRLGMHPDKMQAAISGASVLLRGRTEFRQGDWLETVADADSRDLVYMDPPYLGTSVGQDKRYHQQLASEVLVAGLESLNSRSIRFALSYDGMTGTKEYGPPLPEHLLLSRVLLVAGRSSQATLLGRSETTVESLYLSQNMPSVHVNHALAHIRSQQVLSL